MFLIRWHFPRYCAQSLCVCVCVCVCVIFFTTQQCSIEPLCLCSENPKSNQDRWFTVELLTPTAPLISEDAALRTGPKRSSLLKFDSKRYRSERSPVKAQQRSHTTAGRVKSESLSESFNVYLTPSAIRPSLKENTLIKAQLSQRDSRNRDWDQIPG